MDEYKQKGLTHDLIDLVTNKVKSDVPSLIEYILYMKKKESLSKITCLSLTVEELRTLNEILSDKEIRQLSKGNIYLYLERPTEILFEEYKTLFSRFKIYSVVVNGLVKERINTSIKDDAKIIDSRLWYEYLKNLNKLVSGIDRYISHNVIDREKKIFLILCNRIVESITYDLFSEEDYNKNSKWHSENATNEIVGIISGKCVCRGYAGIVRDACEILGIEENVVYGSDDKVGHAWNQVKLDGEWYNTDITWDADNIQNKRDTYWILKSDNDFNQYGISTNLGNYFHKSYTKNRSFENACHLSVSNDVIKKYLYFEDTIKRNWLNAILDKINSRTERTKRK